MDPPRRDACGLSDPPCKVLGELPLASQTRCRGGCRLPRIPLARGAATPPDPREPVGFRTPKPFLNHLSTQGPAIWPRLNSDLVSRDLVVIFGIYRKNPLPRYGCLESVRLIGRLVCTPSVCAVFLRLGRALHPYRQQ